MRSEQRVNRLRSVFRWLHIAHKLAQSGTAGVPLPREPRLLQCTLEGKQAENNCKLVTVFNLSIVEINPLTPNDPYSGRTAPLTSKRCILYIYSTNIGTEYFKRGIYSPFSFSSK